MELQNNEEKEQMHVGPGVDLCHSRRRDKDRFLGIEFGCPNYECCNYVLHHFLNEP